MIAQCGSPAEWHNCYSGQIDIWHPSAYSHPAKMSPMLCHRILDHLEELGLLKPGNTILDPMAGIATTGLVAASRGYASIMVELEPKFIELARLNVEYLSKKLCLPGFELPMTIIQGDARNLETLLKERGLVAISSPPYQTSEGESIVRRARQVVAHSWAVTDESPRNEGYGSTPGQIGSLPDKPIAITSPPYADQIVKDGQRLASNPDIHWREWERGRKYNEDNPGNISNLPDRPFAAITSPPYEDSRIATSGDIAKEINYERTITREYGQSEGQIGQEQGQTYLEAMKIVYAEIAKVADVLVCVVKNPTRNGKLRRLDLDTIALLEATGWKLHCRHRAVLFEEQEMGHLFEGQVKKPRGRLSFFKRLSYQKGSPVAMWEDVLVAVKNGADGLCAVTSPPWNIAQRDLSTRAYALGVGHEGETDYGSTPGQIGKLRDK